METYFLFGGYNYYPEGGLDDLRDTVEAKSVGEARRIFEERGDFDRIDWWQIGGVGFDGRMKMYAAGTVNKELLYDER